MTLDEIKALRERANSVLAPPREMQSPRIGVPMMFLPSLQRRRGE